MILPGGGPGVFVLILCCPSFVCWFLLWSACSLRLPVPLFASVGLHSALFHSMLGLKRRNRTYRIDTHLSFCSTCIERSLYLYTSIYLYAYIPKYLSISVPVSIPISIYLSVYPPIYLVCIHTYILYGLCHIYTHTTYEMMGFRRMGWYTYEFCTQTCDHRKSADSRPDVSWNQRSSSCGWYWVLGALWHRGIEEFKKQGF